jgi:hypothetical protein
VTINADAIDPGPGASGVKQVRFYWQYCPGGACGIQHSIGADSTPPYSATWMFPSCAEANQDRFLIRARAEDNCGNVGPDSLKDLRIGRSGCFLGGAHDSSAEPWVSELSVPGARGQVVVDGAEAVFPGGGIQAFSVPVGPGRHRLEATLVDASGRPGTWRFDLGALSPVAGSLRVVAGEAALLGSTEVVFRLRGKAGERVVLSFDVGRGAER